MRAWNNRSCYSSPYIRKNMLYNSVQIQDDNDEIELVFNPITNQTSSPVIYSDVPGNIGTNIADWSSCYINLTSTCIGAGIIGIPYAFSKSGWVLGTILILISATLSGFGAHLLALCAVKSKTSPSSFYTVADACIPQYSFIVDMCIAIKCFGVTTSYLFIIGNSLPLAMEQLNTPSVLQNRSVCIALAFVLIAPISFMPSLDALKFTSWLSGAMLLYLVLLIFLYALHIPDTTLFDPCYQMDSETHQCSGSQALVIWNMETVKILSVFIFNFSCQQNVFTIVNELKEPTSRRVDSVFAATMGTATVLYIIVTYSAYSTFGSVMLTDIVKMYPKTPLTTICRILVSLIVAMHFPLQLNPARKSLLSLIRYFGGETGIIVSERQLALRFVFVTGIHLVLNLVMALSFTDLGVTFQLCGATGSTLVIFVLPGLFYFLLHRRDVLTSPPLRSDQGSVKLKSVEDVDMSIHSRISGDTFNVLPTTEGDVASSAAADSRALQGLRGASPRWKLYAAVIMLCIGAIVGPLCVTLIMLG